MFYYNCRDITLLTIITKTEYMILRAWEILKILCQVAAGIKVILKKEPKKDCYSWW